MLPHISITKKQAMYVTEHFSLIVREFLWIEDRKRPERLYLMLLHHYATDSVFLHLLRHLQENDRNILELLASQNNEIFYNTSKAILRN